MTIDAAGDAESARDSVEVRPATLDDVAAVAHLFGELGRHHARIQPDNPRYRVGARRWSGIARDAVESDDQVVHVAVAGDEVVGFVRLHFEGKPWGTSCEIDTLVVDEDHRRAGVGRALLNAAEATARDRGAAGMRADILIGNTEGGAFWDAHGYRAFALRFGRALD